MDRPRGRRQRAADQLRRDLRRSARRAQGGRAGRRAGAHRQPAVRFGHSGRGVGRADDPARRSRARADRRHREHEPGAARHSRPAQRAQARTGQARRLSLGGAPRSVLRLHDGDDRRELRGQVRHHPRRAGLLRAPQPAARRSRAEVGTIRRRNRAGRNQDAEGRADRRPRRSPAAGDDARGAREAAAGVQERRHRHRRQRERHCRRRRGADSRVRRRRRSRTASSRLGAWSTGRRSASSRR